jgi:predicted TIM-barrel fold metal-dependent hydrolase
MAHFGGDESISEYIDQQKKGQPVSTNWHHIICEILRKYPNTFADVSYALWKPKVWPRMKECIDKPEDETPDISNQILFGTDYYMTIQEESEINLVSNFRKAIGNERFRKIAVDNPSRFIDNRVPLISGTIR